VSVDLFVYALRVGAATADSMAGAEQSKDEPPCRHKPTDRVRTSGVPTDRPTGRLCAVLLLRARLLYRTCAVTFFPVRFVGCALPIVL